MKLYLASSFDLAERVDWVASMLKAYGHTITCEWWHRDFKDFRKDLSDSQQSMNQEYLTVECRNCEHRFAISKDFWLGSKCPPNFLGFLDRHVTCCSHADINHAEKGCHVSHIISDQQLREWFLNDVKKGIEIDSKAA